jgi:hypothetical protein
LSGHDCYGHQKLGRMHHQINWNRAVPKILRESHKKVSNE